MLHSTYLPHSIPDMNDLFAKLIVLIIEFAPRLLNPDWFNVDSMSFIMFNHCVIMFLS